RPCAGMQTREDRFGSGWRPRTHSAARAALMTTIARVLSARREWLSIERYEVHLKDEAGIGRDVGRASLVAVPQVRRNPKAALATDFHADDAFVPPLDDLSLANRELERLPAEVVRAIELSAVGQRPGVLNVHRVAGLRLAPRSHDKILYLELRGRGWQRRGLRGLVVARGFFGRLRARR